VFAFSTMAAGDVSVMGLVSAAALVSSCELLVTFT